MTFREFSKVVRERWRLVAAAVVLCLAAATAYHATRPAEYTADLSLYVASQAGDTPQAAYQGAQLSTQRVKSYTGLVDSERVTTEVIARLGLDVTPAALARSIAATSATDSVVIDVGVTATDPVDAARIANAVGDVFTDLVAELERPTDRSATPPVAIRTVKPATPPSTTSSPGLVSVLVPGLLLGLVLGVALALVRNALDTSIKRKAQLEAATGLPVLGEVIRDPRAGQRPLVVHDDPHSPRAEAFRQLRTNLQFVAVDRRVQVIMVTSSVPGEGKSVTVANTALAMAAAGQRVLVVDADLRRPRQAEIFGLEAAVGLTSVLVGRLPGPEQAVQRFRDTRLDVLTSGPLPPNPSELLASQQMRRLLAALRHHYDVVLVDAPPLLPVTDAAAVATSVDGVLLICRRGRTTLAQLTQSLQALRTVGARVLGGLLTMVPAGSGTYERYHAYYGSGPIGAPAPVTGTGASPIDGLLPATTEIPVITPAPAEDRGSVPDRALGALRRIRPSPGPDRSGPSDGEDERERGAGVLAPAAVPTTGPAVRTDGPRSDGRAGDDAAARTVPAPGGRIDEPVPGGAGDLGPVTAASPARPLAGDR